MSRRIASLTARLILVLVSALPLSAQAAVPALPATPQAVSVYATVLRHINPHMQRAQSRSLARELIVNAGRWKLDANVLAAIVTVESAWHTSAISRVGAIGLGQLMPGTAARLGVNPHDPAQNLAGAARYLSGLLSSFGANPRRYELAFAAYNAGPKAVKEFGGIPPYSETQRYVLKVLRAWHHFDATVHVPQEALAAQMQGDDVSFWTGATR